MYKKLLILLAMVLACQMVFADGGSSVLTKDKSLSLPTDAADAEREYCCEAHRDGKTSRYDANGEYALSMLHHTPYKTNQELIAAMSKAGQKLQELSSESIEVQRAVTCGVCGKGYMNTGTTYTPWAYNGKYRKCTHFPFGVDEQQQRRKTVTYSCSYCGYSSYSDTMEYKWVCFGHY